MNQSHAEFYSLADQLFFTIFILSTTWVSVSPWLWHSEVQHPPAAQAAQFSLQLQKERQPASNLHMSDNNHSEV